MPYPLRTIPTVMILPIRMIWNLQIPRRQKQSIGAIFGVGVICIIVAIIRVVQIGVKSRSDSTPSSSWLALWAMIEAAIGTSSFPLCTPPIKKDHHLGNEHPSFPPAPRWLYSRTSAEQARFCSDNNRLPPLLRCRVPQHSQLPPRLLAKLLQRPPEHASPQQGRAFIQHVDRQSHDGARARLNVGPGKHGHVEQSGGAGEARKDCRHKECPD
jgi:hypothetical protein